MYYECHGNEYAKEDENLDLLGFESRKKFGSQTSGLGYFFNPQIDSNPLHVPIPQKNKENCYIFFHFHCKPNEVFLAKKYRVFFLFLTFFFLLRKRLGSNEKM
jgi:hypothetical protein